LAAIALSQSVVVLSVLGGCSDGELEAGPADDVVVLRTEFEIGVTDGDPAYEFGGISGIALDSDGRIFVADPLAHQIRVYDAAGTALFAFGTRGDAPGELRNPCCINFDDRGRLWVWSPRGTLRYDVFTVARGGAAFAFRLPGGSIGQLQARRIVFDAGGRLVHAAFRRAEGERGHVRLLIDSAGAEIGRVYPPYVPPDSLGMYSVQIRSPVGGSMKVFMSGPATAAHPIAYSPRGDFADAITSRYRIRWFDAAGRLVRVIERPIAAGPAVSRSERESMEAKIRADRAAAERMGAAPPDMTVPSRKPPLEDLFFDLDGRLWVVRTPAADDTLATADVFDPEGAYLFTARWPSTIALRHGAITGSIALGVNRDSLGVARLTRLHIGTAP
jgi:hypothetical protein